MGKRIAALAALLALAGCLPLVVGTSVLVGRYVYVEGELWRTYHVPRADAREAVLEAGESLGIAFSGSVDTGVTETWEGTYPDGTSLTVDIRTLEAGRMEIGVRAGPTGLLDRAQAREFHEAVEQELR